MKKWEHRTVCTVQYLLYKTNAFIVKRKTVKHTKMLKMRLWIFFSAYHVLYLGFPTNYVYIDEQKMP